MWSTSSSKVQHNCATPQSKSPPLTPSCSSAPPTAAAARVRAGDSPYVRAKHFQLVDRDPNKAIPLFWSAINHGDRVDSALKDMAAAMKQAGRSEEAIEAIRSFRGLCSIDAQEPIDNLLLDLYKKCGRIHDEIELLSLKLKLIDRGLALGGRATKLSRSQGKRFHVSLDKERSRLLGNLAWAYMRTENYKEAEPLYRQALAIEPDCNKQCNLAICLMRTGRLPEAKSLLQSVPKPSGNCTNAEPYLRSFERAFEILEEPGQQSSTPARVKEKELQAGVQSASSTPSATDVPGLPNEQLHSPSSYFTPRPEFRKERRIHHSRNFYGSSEYYGSEKEKCAGGTKEEERFMAPSEGDAAAIGEKVVAKETDEEDQGPVPLQERVSSKSWEKICVGTTGGGEREQLEASLVSSKGRRTWADMVEEEEEEEEELMAFGDENVNSSNIVRSSIIPQQKHRNPKGGSECYGTAGRTPGSVSFSARRRSLSFNLDGLCSNYEGCVKRNRQLQVLREIDHT